jgi:gluconolactonase
MAIMRTTWLPLLVLMLLGLALLGTPPALGQDPKTSSTLGTIERLDSALDQLVPRNAVVEKLASGFAWAEGPVWIRSGKFLLFSDIPNNTVFQWKEGAGIAPFMKPSGYEKGRDPNTPPRAGEPGSNGLLVDPEGRLVLCEHGDRRVSVVERNGQKVTLADRYQGKRLNSPNDGVFRSNGDLYFTDPPYGLEKNWDDPARELDFCGVYRLTKSGQLTLLTKEMTRPNGIAFSPDERTLYVANSDPERAVWMAFPVNSDGTLGTGRVFFDSTAWAKAKKPGLPDGMKVDQAGNLFATGPGGVHIFTPTGKHLGTFNTGVPTANCGWGDDGTVLYITANHDLCRIKLSTKGKGW